MPNPYENAKAVPKPDAPKLGQGNIKFDLGNETYELRPTINAMRMLNQKYGGMQNVMDKIIGMDMQAIEDVLVAGLGPSYQNPKARNQLMEKVFAEGVTDDTGQFMLKCQRYVVSLLRGGKPYSPNDPENDGNAMDADPNGTSSS